jgi:murein DD-endopeptidase MepM/ murein hydrolase activator NlpD
MGSTLLLFASLAAAQGQALEIAIPHEAGLEAVEAQWGGRAMPFVREGDQWLAVVGIDLEAAPGRRSVPIALRFSGGRSTARAEEILVAARDFPTTRLEVEPRYVELSPEDQARAARENREIDAIYAAFTTERLWREPFQSPIPGVQGGRNFGHRRIFNGQPRAPHSGADLRAATGTPIRAANRGRVVLAKDLFFSGNAVFLDHGLGVYSVYLHLSDIQVATGDIVERGAVVVLAGATGRVTGPHLHWGARVLDARVDPFTLLELGAE